ncbi:nitroreductase [Candidatus Epulonipiscium fishelsonii]|uniref:Nitroreductase n=1 Tax=Candidatus Epulonipiscium fishelsonii TaxID=77094 RepID=A0ACC8XI22_9FIRM|nr:nitroreductase [Epulopiscium sp. SCG-D08WGA-EpuloA1]
MNAIFTRRSVRQFADKTVEQEKIEKILRAAMQAPSANNQQPWDFIVVEGKENLDKLSKYNPYAGCLKNASAAIIVLGNTERIMFPHWEQDLGAATQNIQLEAVELGLGSVWLGTAPNKERMEFIRKLYGLNENMLPYSVIALGYPKDTNANHFTDRYDASRIKYIK